MGSFFYRSYSLHNKLIFINDTYFCNSPRALFTPSLVFLMETFAEVQIYLPLINKAKEDMRATVNIGTHKEFTHPQDKMMTKKQRILSQ